MPWLSPVGRPANEQVISRTPAALRTATGSARQGSQRIRSRTRHRTGRGLEDSALWSCPIVSDVGCSQGIRTGQAPAAHHEPGPPPWLKLTGAAELYGSFLQWCLEVVQAAGARPTSSVLTCQSRAAAAWS